MTEPGRRTRPGFMPEDREIRLCDLSGAGVYCVGRKILFCGYPIGLFFMGGYDIIFLYK